MLNIVLQIWATLMTSSYIDSLGGKIPWICKDSYKIISISLETESKLYTDCL